MEILKAIDGLADDLLRSKGQHAIAAIQRTIDLYGAVGTAFSFNGGKDSTVLLQLIRAAVCQRRSATDSSATASNAVPNGTAESANVESDLGEATATNGTAAAASADARDSDGNAPDGLGGICTFVFHCSDDFQEIRDFMAETDGRYGLRLEVLQGDFKQGLASLVDGRGVRAIILGTRRGDPNAEGQEFFCPSSVGWPPFMRVNPVLDWTYSDVWAFLRATGSPYCELYDRGFTSIGGINNTEPNSSLEKEDGSFAPAHVLADGRLERAGRAWRPLLRRRSMPPSLTRSAGLAIIGDEILAAKVDDTNSNWLCAQLRAIGWHVKKVVVIPDDVAAIAAEVHVLSEQMDLVITSGGVGPTPDDVTMAGVAAAFGLPLACDPALESRLRAYFGDNLTAAHLKLAEVPEGEVELIDHRFDNGAGEVSPFSLPRCRNVYILPGIPSLLQQKWRTLREHLLKGSGSGKPFRSIVLRLRVSDETRIAPALEHLNASMPDRLSVGSYPVSSQADDAGIVLSLESKDLDTLQTARDFLLRELPPDVLLSEEADSAHYSTSSTP